MNKGKVYLVGAGPGDPGLISVKAVEILENADIVIYDYLANDILLNYSKGEKIYVGKQGSAHTFSQESINKLIVEKSIAGKRVVRLKGGDPFIFGRGGEEAEELLTSNIPFEIIPGISSFYSAPAYAGIPLTHRDYADSFEVITGHKKEGADDDINFPFYNSRKTFVFLMGMKNLAYIASTLIKSYRFPGDTPVAIISRGTYPDQRCITSTLDYISKEAEENGIKAPAIIVIGQVVKLRQKIKWFEQRPLSGKKIVVTRTREQASSISRKLSNLGAQVIEFPVLKIEPEKDLKYFIDRLKNLDNYNWIIFTSQNAVEIFFKELFLIKKDVRFLCTAKIAAIGRVTAEMLKTYGIMPDLVPREFIAESLVKAFAGINLKGKRILLPCSAKARPLIKDELEKQGALVERVHIYNAVKPDYFDEDIQKVIDADIVTFASSSTVENFFEIIKEDIKAVFASIGPITSKTVESYGKKVEIEAEEYTIDGLVDSVLKWCQR